jgi:cytochrome c556
MKAGFAACLVLLILSSAVRPQPMTPVDTRQPVALTAVERAWVLHSMRGHVDALHDIAAGVGSGDFSKAEAAAFAMSTDVMKADSTRPGTLRSKLPPAWIAMVLAMHHEFDGIDDALRAHESATALMARLGRVTGQCVACHGVYRIQAQD